MMVVGIERSEAGNRVILYVADRSKENGRMSIV